MRRLVSGDDPRRWRSKTQSRSASRRPLHSPPGPSSHPSAPVRPEAQKMKRRGAGKDTSSAPQRHRERGENAEESLTSSQTSPSDDENSWDKMASCPTY